MLLVSAMRQGWFDADYESKLVWSNSGSIARISDDGSMISFYVYAVDKKTGNWKLIGPSRHPIVGQKFVHLQFNLLGHELAAVDEFGRTYLYSLLGGVGNMQAASLDTKGQTELDAVVGLHWLPICPLDCRVSLDE